MHACEFVLCLSAFKTKKIQAIFCLIHFFVKDYTPSGQRVDISSSAIFSSSALLPREATLRTRLARTKIRTWTYIGHLSPIHTADADATQLSSCVASAVRTMINITAAGLLFSHDSAHHLSVRPSLWPCHLIRCTSHHIYGGLLFHRYIGLYIPRRRGVRNNSCKLHGCWQRSTPTGANEHATT